MTSLQSWARSGALVALLMAPSFAQGDDCSAATAIVGTGNWAFDTTTATTTGFSGGSACINAGSLDVGPDQFYQWTADVAGSWQIDTCGSNYDTKLNIHAGTGCAATCSLYNDDGPCGSFHSVLVLAGVSVGDTFLFQVGGYAGSSGIGVLNTAALGAPGTNDDCSIADVIGGYGIWTFNTTGASTSGFSGGSACTNAGSLDVGPDQFWQWTATVAGDVEVSLEGSLYDTKLNVHTGTGCAATCLAYNDDSYGLQSSVSITGVNAGDTFLIQIGGFAGQSGAGTLEVKSYVDPCIALGDDSFEDNDDTSTATVLAAGTYTALVCHQVDPDFYEFTLQPGDILDVTIFPFLDDLDLTEYDGMGNWVADWNTNALSHSNVTGAVETWIVEIRDDPGFGGDCSDYDMTVTIAPDPCQNVADDSFEENDACASTSAIGDGTHSALFVAKADPDYYSFTVADGTTFTADVLFISVNGDLDAMLFESGLCTDDQASACTGTLACGFSASDNENLIWTNTTGADMDCTLRVHVWPNTANNCNTYDLVVAGAGPGGPALFCSPANTHSGGGFATLGTSSVSGPGLYHLEATDGPVNQFAYFLVSAGSMDPGVSVSQGQLCLSAPQGRYSPVAGGSLNSISQFDGAGVLQNLAGTSSVGTGYDVPAVLPSPPGGVIATGDTWHFQLWYRDGAASNFSDGISVTF